MKTVLKNQYIPTNSGKPLFGAVEHTYSVLSAKYGLHNFFDPRITRNISYAANILQRAKMSGMAGVDNVQNPFRFLKK